MEDLTSQETEMETEMETEIETETETEIEMGQIENTAILYFFHGSGCNGRNMKTWLEKLCKKKFSFPHIKVIFPSAPMKNYKLNLNRKSYVWFDEEELTESSNEVKESVNEMCNEMLLSIDKEVEKGTPYDKIIVGGFSMGGTFALHLAYRFNKPFAGCFAISSFLNHDSQVYESLQANCESHKPQLLLLHGINDAIIPVKWSELLKKNLVSVGVNVTLKTYSYTDHEIIEKEVVFLRDWVLRLLPSPISEPPQSPITEKYNPNTQWTRRPY